MKYNITINQLALHNTRFDLIDCAILDYLYFYCNSPSDKVEEYRVRDKDNTWTWVDYSRILDDMPLLRLKSVSVVSERIKKIKEAGYIDTYRPDHRKMYIKMTDKVDELFVQTNRTIRSDEQSYSASRTNNNTIDNNTKIHRDEAFKTFWELYPKKIAKPTAYKAFTKLTVTETSDLIKKILVFKKSEQWTKDRGQYIPHPATFINQRRWEDEVEVIEDFIPAYMKEYKLPK